MVTEALPQSPGISLDSRYRHAAQATNQNIRVNFTADAKPKEKGGTAGMYVGTPNTATYNLRKVKGGVTN